MLKRLRSRRSLAVAVAAAGSLAVALPTVGFAGPGQAHRIEGAATAAQARSNRDPSVHQTNLVSDRPGMAKLTDPNLKNPWGLAMGAATPLWVSNQGSDNATLFSLPPGSDNVAPNSMIKVTMPGSAAGPSGQVANPGKGFVLHHGSTSGPAAFIFATLDGHIQAWSPTVDPHIGNAENKVTVHGAGYTGLAIATTRSGHDQLYAANLTQGRIDIFDSSFHQIKKAPGQFRDAHLPNGYRPFNTQTLNGHVFVTYDKIDAKTGREAVGKHLGVVDEYNADGQFMARIASGGDLNAPWGLAIAPAGWGRTAGSLLVGNFGDGRINVIDQHNGRFDHSIDGQVQNSMTHRPFAEPGLWALLPGTTTTGGTNAVWFSAGVGNEAHGLLGVLRP